MAFNRIVELKAGTSESSVIISDLHISFDINRSRKFSNNVAKFKIYNPKEDTISRILKQGNSIIFKAGYEDEGVGLIYVGQITQSIPDKKPPNRIVDVECGSIQNANTALEAVTLSIAYQKGTSITRPLNEIGNALGLSVIGMENASHVILPNGFNFAGTVKDAMRYCQNVLNNYRIGLFIDNTTLSIYKDEDGNNLRAVKLTYQNGLIEAPKLTDNTEGSEETLKSLKNRVLFKSILNYKIVPNGYVRIETSDVNGDFIVDKCQFAGDNFGGNFYVSGEGLGS